MSWFCPTDIGRSANAVRSADLQVCPVLNTRGGALDSAVQVIVDERVPLDVDGLEC